MLLEELLRPELCREAPDCGTMSKFGDGATVQMCRGVPTIRAFANNLKGLSNKRPIPYLQSVHAVLLQLKILSVTETREEIQHDTLLE